MLFTRVAGNVLMKAGPGPSQLAATQMHRACVQHTHAHYMSE